jgi:hypothetical protein
VFICTSATRPAWGAAQAGRLAFLTDAKQLTYWTGTGWADLRDSAPGFAGGALVNSSVSPGSSGSYNVLTVSTPRASSLAIWLTGSYTCPNNKTQGANQQISFDGVNQQMGGFPEGIRFAGTPGDSGLSLGIEAVSMAVIPSVLPGQHKIGGTVTVSSSYPTAIGVTGMKVIALLMAYTSGNSL